MLLLYIKYRTHPILWPIGDGDRFKGVLDRTTNLVHLYQKPAKRGGKAEVIEIPLTDSHQLQQRIADDELYEKLMEDAQLLEGLLNPLDMTRIMSGDQSPLFFGSAMTNFGVQLFLDTFCRMGTKPLGRLAVQREDNSPSSEDGINNLVPPENEEFTGFIFKTQANLDPKHRDRLAFVRIVSGTYVKGMKVGHSRSKVGKKYKYVYVFFINFILYWSIIITTFFLLRK